MSNFAYKLAILAEELMCQCCFSVFLVPQKAPPPKKKNNNNKQTKKQNKTFIPSYFLPTNIPSWLVFVLISMSVC